MRKTNREVSCKTEKSDYKVNRMKFLFSLMLGLFVLNPMLNAQQSNYNGIAGLCHRATTTPSSYQACVQSGASPLKVRECGAVASSGAFLGCITSPANADQVAGCHQATSLPGTFLQCLAIAYERKLLYVEITYCGGQTLTRGSLLSCLSIPNLGI